MTPGFRVIAALALLAVAPPVLAAHAQAGSRHDNGFTVRYNALSANALPEAAAKRLDLRPSAKQGIVNISVTRGKGLDAPSVTATVVGHAMTSTGTVIPIHFRTIHDGNCISYLGTFTVHGSDTLQFDLEVTPKGGSRQHVHFKQVFLLH
jgi:hypothetical protein